ncbi:hypothetical protein BSLG_004233 [Batrachochytrium salamandrivorans]|nr:hypothetical protein BASA83_007390 [Batrachochytrium salamandrivorans]KAJ1341167.1 hypothetical protein BSLG_004233 [Batrachochytrium salamandrivorans]
MQVFSRTLITLRPSGVGITPGSNPARPPTTLLVSTGTTANSSIGSTSNRTTHGAAAAAGATKGNANTPPSKPSGGLKQLFKEYGPVGFITYSGISSISYPSWVAAVYFGLDVSPVVSTMDDMKRWCSAMYTKTCNRISPETHAHTGLAIAPPARTDIISDAATNHHDGNNDHTSSPSFYTTMGTTLLVAMAGHKIIFPLRAALTMFLTPAVARFMRANHLEFWMRKSSV